MRNNQLEHFRDAMSPFKDHFILFGGNGCALLLESLGDEFRQTEDLDIVLIIEKWSNSFAKALSCYIENGGYRGKSYHSVNGEVKCKGNTYRFDLQQGSKNIGIYPTQIELFSRCPEELFPRERPAHISPEDYKEHIIPIEAGVGVSNFSAILFDDDYYEYLRGKATEIEGVLVPSAECLTVLKCSAYLNNLNDLKTGKLDSKREVDVYKHVFDIASLLVHVDEDHISTSELPDVVKTDMLSVIETLKDSAEISKAEGFAGQKGVETPFPLSDLPEILEDLFKV